MVCTRLPLFHRTVFNIPVAFANNIGNSGCPLYFVPFTDSNVSLAVHLIFRFLTGFCGAAFLSVAGGTVTDLFENEHVGVPMALYSASRKLDLFLYLVE